MQDNGSGISPDNYENVGEYFLEAQMNNLALVMYNDSHADHPIR